MLQKKLKRFIQFSPYIGLEKHLGGKGFQEGPLYQKRKLHEVIKFKTTDSLRMSSKQR